MSNFYTIAELSGKFRMKFIMNFLRSPFQFRSSEQPSRKAESESPNVENMFIDPSDPKWKTAAPGIGASSSIPGSPRLQHRVPGFENNGNNPIEMMHEPSATPHASNEDCDKSPHIHVVPIKVESVDDSCSPKKRSSAFHSNSGTIPRSCHFGYAHPSFEDLNSRKRHSSGPALHKKMDSAESKSKVCNIPIFVEGRDTPVVPKTSQSADNVPMHNIPSPNTQPAPVKQNGANLTKSSGKHKDKKDPKRMACDASLKQISDILAGFQSLKSAVREFRGSSQDKQYRYLDEMLTRCMLKLDYVETHGDDEVRASRKAAVKAVLGCINDLESRAQGHSGLEHQPETVSGSTEQKYPLETDNGAGEKCVFSDCKDTSLPHEQADLALGENLQPTGEAIGSTKDPQNSAPREQSADSKDAEVPQQESMCLEQNNSDETKPSESFEVMKATSPVCVETAAAEMGNELEKSVGFVHQTVDMEETEATKDEQLQQLRLQVQDRVGVKGYKDSGVESMEVTNSERNECGSTEIPMQVDRMDSAIVPEAKVDNSEAQNELMDQELAREPIVEKNACTDMMLVDATGKN